MPEPLYRNLLVAVAPQPKQLPPPPFEEEDLQRAFFDVSRVYKYQQFTRLPDGGAQFSNAPEDTTIVLPNSLQVARHVDTAHGQVRSQVLDIFKALNDRLRLDSFFQCFIKVVAVVPAPGSAMEFVSEKLIRVPEEAVKELGPTFFGGGIKLRSLNDTKTQEDVLLIEPYVADDQYLWVSHDVQHTELFTVDDLGGWLEQAFQFVDERVMGILEV